MGLYNTLWNQFAMEPHHFSRVIIELNGSLINRGRFMIPSSRWSQATAWWHGLDLFMGPKRGWSQSHLKGFFFYPALQGETPCGPFPNDVASMLLFVSSRPRWRHDRTNLGWIPVVVPCTPMIVWQFLNPIRSGYLRSYSCWVSLIAESLFKQFPCLFLK